MDIVLDFVTYGHKNEFRKGTKRAYVVERYEGNNRFLMVYYYDNSIKGLGLATCCQPVSKCKNEKSAIRCINKFFNV